MRERALVAAVGEPPGAYGTRGVRLSWDTESRPGFSLLELLIVVVILGILAAGGTAVFSVGGGQAKEAALSGNLREGWRWPIPQCSARRHRSWRAVPVQGTPDGRGRGRPTRGLPGSALKLRFWAFKATWC